MSSLTRTALAVAALLLAAPLAAQNGPRVSAPAPLPDLTGMTSQQIYELFAKDENRWSREPCSFGAPVLLALEAKAPRPVPIRRLRLIAEALCADTEERFADGARVMQQVRALTPDDPATGMAIYFARRQGDAASVLALLGGLGQKEIEQLDDSDYFAAGRMLRTHGRGEAFDALALQWVDEGKLPFFDTDLHSPIAFDALRAAARAGRNDLVDQLLLPITSPGNYVVLLTHREFEPFWPQIEQRAGPNLAAIGEENVNLTRTRLINAPEDRDRFSDAAHALHYNGQFAEAIALAQRWRDRAESGKAIEEGDAWALNIQAYARDSLGQHEAADAVFDELAKLDPEQHNWLVNFVINRASRLVGQGRWEEGLAAVDLARTVADTQGTTYAKMIVAANRACALEKLGRAEEAVEELSFLRANVKESHALAVRGLVCHGHRDEAAALLLTGLRDPEQRPVALEAFQTDELDLFYTASILPQASDLPPFYPELADELARHMRPIPEAYIPQASLKRV
ncbi:tetratricopeptide repeat protein [Porphyrobacter sp. YT40]|uniref:tetratricopeptide repeat protein n=1 Tax=Porphyrobacter sp. YT40 TaxID=2547601 RepID=UPI001142AA42|nr:tetratricopeptide repeat protein [Porphyrobacter sp. YT40]QDH35918.1 tetratricopeptide repeat protein [Porphyrobacter sp. YT40]